MVKKVTIWYFIWFITLLIALLIDRQGEFSTDRLGAQEDSNTEIRTVMDAVEEHMEKFYNEKKAEEIREQEKRERERERRIAQAKRVSRGSFNKDTSMKSYMDYRAITSKSSPQYKLQYSGDVHTDKEGFRRVDDKYVVAVGTHYADSIGEILEIELDTGKTFKAVVGDFKANRHTGSRNMQHKVDNSVVEFIVDTRNMCSLSKKMGDMSHAEDASMSGKVVSVINLTRIEKGE